VGNSVLAYTREAMTPDVCKDVEVIGWLYQFYISERKDHVMARKSAVPTEDIPSVTQLFTPHWIVRYLVENSLGRLWLLNRPQSRLREKMPYYIEGEPENDFLKISTPEEIRLLDPAVGSGHMLTYAFDLLYSIYEEEGIEPTEIAQKILTHNLFGIEIDERAGELAAFALTMKARAKHRRFFSKSIQPNVIVLENVLFDAGELAEYVAFIDRDLFNQALIKLLHQFEEAKDFGSLIQPCLDERTIAEVRRAIEGKDLGAQLFLRETHLKVLRVLEQAEALSQRYHVVVANPPYMGNKAQPKSLKQLLEQFFPSGKPDLFSAFVLRNQSLALPRGHLGFMTPFTWMFITTYSEFRREILTNSCIQSLIQPEYHSFFDSAFVPICCFILRSMRSNAPAVFIDLSDHYGGDVQSVKALEAIQDPKCPWRHEVTASAFLAIPGSPIAFNLSPKLLNAFKTFPSLGELVPVKEGLNTGDNERFLRFWQEVSHDQICLRRPSDTDYRAESFRIRWFPCNKGGPFRRWYGNNEYVIDWKDDGAGMKEFRDPSGKQLAALRNLQFLFKQGLTWSGVSLSGFSAREFPPGFAFNSAGRSLFTNELNHKWLLGALNSAVSFKVLNVLAPTMSVTVGVVASLPVPPQNENLLSQLTPVIDEASGSMRADWDNFEISWDFRDQPLLRPGLKGATLEVSWQNWEAQSFTAIRRMQELEKENNRLFISAYGLDGDLNPAVPEEQITLARADVSRDMAAFLSYAVGCMFGRYALEKPGLILANQGETFADYLKQIPEPSFPADKDNVIPMLDGDWFTDDITDRFRQFLRVTFGDEHYEENLKFIEKAIGKDIRKYFLKDFYSDHVKRYKKRPIYWLFSSPKGSFNALIYMHRYRPDTVSIILNDYLREFRTKLAARLDHLKRVDASADASKTEKAKALKEINDLKKTIDELNTWEHEVLYPLATRNIEIDLDEGVKANYQKFGSALKKIPGLDAKEED